MARTRWNVPLRLAATMGTLGVVLCLAPFFASLLVDRLTGSELPAGDWMLWLLLAGFLLVLFSVPLGVFGWRDLKDDAMRNGRLIPAIHWPRVSLLITALFVVAFVAGTWLSIGSPLSALVALGVLLVLALPGIAAGWLGWVAKLARESGQQGPLLQGASSLWTTTTWTDYALINVAKAYGVIELILSRQLFARSPAAATSLLPFAVLLVAAYAMGVSCALSALWIKRLPGAVLLPVEPVPASVEHAHQADSAP